MKEHITQQLESRIREQVALTNVEAQLAIDAATHKNKTWRIKYATDRRRVSERLDVLNGEIFGLATVLNGVR